ncbi:hypothetical protein O1Q96_21955 [Streptomyces sp. Qhu-G9]|uniref:hypothetical protein n=1 Tax=Streptomyces sp. Qhu-G9 TaxID=3452799 RepID=UPI0022ABCF15|nr:hypothetical protein [Streptomyces aurantiacus]WAU82198.1 hypothetical protein O1Q96_21955 [Streptomyces aurantiacus]
MAVTTSPYAIDALPGGTVDAVVIGGGAAGLNGALMLARSRRSGVAIASGSPRNAPTSAMHGFTTGGQVVGRRVLAVATQMQARTEGLDALKLPMEDLPDNMGRRFASGMAGTTEVPGVWVAGTATDLAAQVDASAAAGSLAGAHINAVLATADPDAALAAAQGETPAP